MVPWSSTDYAQNAISLEPCTAPISPSVAAVSFYTAFISTSVISHTIRFHLVKSAYTVKLVAGTIL